MKIRITTAFNDMQAKDDDKRRIEVGAEPTVTAERGAELIALGLAEDASPAGGDAGDK